MVVLLLLLLSLLHLWSLIMIYHTTISIARPVLHCHWNTLLFLLFGLCFQHMRLINLLFDNIMLFYSWVLLWANWNIHTAHCLCPQISHNSLSVNAECALHKQQNIHPLIWMFLSTFILWLTLMVCILSLHHAFSRALSPSSLCRDATMLFP